MSPDAHPVVVLGASPKSSRYSNRAVRMLKAHGYPVIPVHPRVAEIEGLPVAPGLETVVGPVHTLTLYVGPQRSRRLIQGIVDLAPGRVILNPGTESDELESALGEAGIGHLHACTLVMLSTGQF